LAEVISKQLDAAIAGEWRQDKVELLIDLYNRETRAVRQHSADLRLTKIARLGNQLNADRAVRNQALRRPWNE
jgi:hypothetical protein